MVDKTDYTPKTAEEYIKFDKAMRHSLEPFEFEFTMIASENNSLRREVKYLNNALTEELDNRDTYHEYADKLANLVAKYLNIDIGEHSNINNPWMNAIEELEWRIDKDVPN